MSKIKQLPLEVYEKIKAGEVIEDPASVVRELLDNCIDAKADKILVEIEEGGISKILVRDNGIGMSLEDLRMAPLQHCTSKIEDFNDIFKLSTAGFRGEALAGVARVSFLRIASKEKDQELGHFVHVENGEVVKEGATAHQKGTSIEVSKLFYNVPVRKGFLKSPVREGNKVKNELNSKALAYPHIHFQLKSGANTLLNYPPKNWEERIKDVFELDYDFMPFLAKSESLKVKGVLTSLNTTFSNSSKLFFFVNNKNVRPAFFYGVIRNAFSDLIPRGRYPGGAIYVYTDPSNIDPNVHPSKKEIKIFNEDQIARTLYKGVKQLFSPKKDENIENLSLSELEKKAEDSSLSYNSETILNIESKNGSQEESLLFLQKQENISDTRQEIKEEVFFKYLGVVFQTYLLIEEAETLFFIDFHAAHERLRYEDLKAKNNQAKTQSLLTPRIFHFDSKDMEKINEYKNEIEALGFAFYFFGEDAITVNEIPQFYKNQNWENDFKDIVNDLDVKKIDISSLRDSFFKRVACRGSYMSGESISYQEARELYLIIREEKIPLTCPHGRPFIYSMPKHSLETKFLRG